MWIKEIHSLAKKKGWWSEPRSDGDVIALIMSELGETVEAFRNDESLDKDGLTFKSQECDIDCQLYVHEKGEHEDEVEPEGPSIELVDAVIRIFDYFGYRKWDFEKVLEMKHAYNKKRDWRHGKKW